MKWIREEVLKGEFLSGIWLNLASSLTAEIAGHMGFDWVVLDMEHGAGGHRDLMLQLQALESSSTVPIVRIEWNDPARFKRALDLGPAGIMVPYVSTAEEARLAVTSMRYPPKGIRGVARFNRAVAFGLQFDEYFAEANDNLLTIIQIETTEAIQNADQIAAVDGVDVLFVGPMDLSTSLGIPMQFEHPMFLDALNRTSAAARDAGKALGILILRPEDIAPMLDLGFTFIALGSDGALVAEGMKRNAKLLSQARQYQKG